MPISKLTQIPFVPLRPDTDRQGQASRRETIATSTPSLSTLEPGAVRRGRDAIPIWHGC